MCAAFSQLQNINFSKMSPEDVMQVKEYGRRHLEFCIELYNIQRKMGLYFLHEHPAGAASWSNEKMMELMGNEEVIRVTGHMCRFGMTSNDEYGNEHG